MRFTIATAATIALAALAATAGAAASAMIFSNYYVAPGGEVLLGEGMAGQYSISGENVGQVAVQIFAREDGRDRMLGRVEPGADIHQDFARNEVAVLANTSPGTEAVVMVRMGGSDHLGAAGGPGHKFDRE